MGEAGDIFDVKHFSTERLGGIVNEAIAHIGESDNSIRPDGNMGKLVVSIGSADCHGRRAVRRAGKV